MKPFIDPAFWSDADIESLSPELKLAVLWLLTNPRTNALGVCSATEQRFAFETGLPAEGLARAIQALPRAFMQIGSAIFIRHYVRHQFGTGEKLQRNNFFVFMTKLLNQIRDEGLVSEILAEYPEFEQSPPEGLTKPSGPPKDRKGIGREGKEVGESRGEGDVSTGNGALTHGNTKARSAADDALEILEYLNQKAGRKHRAVAVNLKFIKARLCELGVTLDGCRLMIDRQCALWLNTPQAEYLRPETLFNATKFTAYYDQRDLPLPPRDKLTGRAADHARQADIHTKTNPRAGI